MPGLHFGRSQAQSIGPHVCGANSGKHWVNQQAPSASLDITERTSEMTRLVKGNELAALVGGMISAKKQQGAFGVALTVKRVRRVLAGGSLDFGGSEFQRASTESLDPVKKGVEEPYGWWSLVEGAYLVEYNERIPSSDNRLIWICAHERLIHAGGSHSPVLTKSVNEGTSVLLSVGSGGLHIKENARISEAAVFEYQ